MVINPARPDPDGTITATDSYKLGHWEQYPKDAEGVYSYLESRSGAEFPWTVFFGLQYIIKRYLEGSVVDWDDISAITPLAAEHFGRNGTFNYRGWSRIKNEHAGRLPLRIKAVPEGTVVPTGNVLMTVENTDPRCYWLTNAVESLLTHVWYPSTVATLSKYTIENRIAPFLRDTADTMDALPFMLHDFGYRGASSHESASIGGLGHLINSMGTDTVPALLYAQEYYGAKGAVGASVTATEHSVMTAMGEQSEFVVVEQLIGSNPSGILSVVGDSYDIYRFVLRIGSLYKAAIMARDGVFVVRPDSITPTHRTPAVLVAWILGQLWHDFGGTENQKGYKVLDPHVRVLWGDGIDPNGIEDILRYAADSGFSAENLVFGMGGGLLQKVNRDTQRFAFKASAIKRHGAWHEVYKHPLDRSKLSKRGRLSLVATGPGEFRTVPETADGDMLFTVFENGELTHEYTFEEVRHNAGSVVPIAA